MKILYLCLNSMMRLNHPSGYATHIREVTTAFQELGHEVLVRRGSEEDENATSHFSNIFKASIIKRLPKYIRVLGREIFEIVHNIKIARQVQEDIESFKPDIIYERASSFINAGSLAASKENIPHFLELNAPLSEERKKLSGSCLYSLEEKSLKKNFDNALKIFVVSKALKKWLINKGIDSAKVVVVPNGVNTDEFNSSKFSPKESKEMLHIDGKVTIGYVGTSLEFHGLIFLLSILDRLYAKNKEIYFLGVISGTGLEDIRNHYQNRLYCRLVESVKHEEVPKLISAMDICVMPDSNWYGSPIKIFEYGAMEKAVVAVRTEPIEEIVEDGKDGRLFHQGSAQEFLEILDDYIHHPEKRIQSGKNLREKIAREFTWKENARRILEVIREVIKDSK